MPSLWPQFPKQEILLTFPSIQIFGAECCAISLYIFFHFKKFRFFFLRNSFSNRGECRVTFPVLNQFPTLEPRSSAGLHSFFLLKLISVCWCSHNPVPLNCCKGFKKVLNKKSIYRKNKSLPL